MRVLINGLATLKAKTGVGHHIADLFAALPAADPSSSFTLYPGAMLGRFAGNASGGTKSAMANPRNEWKTRVRTAAIASAKFGIRAHFAAYSRAFRFDLYHEPNFVPFPSPLPTVVTVHDLSVLKFPEWHPADRVLYHERHFFKGLQRAAHVIVVSEAVRQEMIAELNFDPARVTTVYNGLGPQFQPQSAESIARVQRDFELPTKFFLCVGTVEPRKNLSRVIRAFIDLPKSVREACPLILAGPWGWKADADRGLFESSGRAAGARHLGYVPANQLPALYAAARVLLYPSHYEGFGLPPAEMLACGGAVIASTANALREVLGNVGTLIDPNDTAAWRHAMELAANDDDYVQMLSRGGREQSAKFTWYRAALETVAVYRKVFGFTHSPVTTTKTTPR